MAAPHDSEVLTFLNFIPVVTLCCVVFGAGALAQRMKEAEREIARLRTRVHRMSNHLAAAGWEISAHERNEENELE